MELGHRDMMAALVRVSADVELQFIRDKKDCGPLHVVMTMLRRDAIQALFSMVKQDPSDVEQMRKLQNEVQRYIDMVESVKSIISKGESAMAELEPEEKEEVKRLILGEDAQEDDT